MNIGLGNLWILLALSALAIPIVLHLLQRRRFDTLDWGAMQFLPDSMASQRRRWLDEFLLLLVRMGVIAAIVFALATPFSTSAWLAPLREGATRDIVLVLDGSYSMARRQGDHPTPWQEAVRWATDRMARASRGERFAVLVARQPPLAWQGDFATDVELDHLPEPRGNPGMPQALAEAWKRLQTNSTATQREVIVVSDQQHFGWADPAALTAFDSLGNQWHAEIEQARSDGRAVPSLRIVNVGGDARQSPENYAVAAVTAPRRIVRVGQKLTFRTALQLDGFDRFVAPRQVAVAVNGKRTQVLPLPDRVSLKQGQIPLTFQHRFEHEGQHVVTVTIDVDPARDALAADNEQHVVIEAVKELPVLLVEGAEFAIRGQESSSYFLQRALAGENRGTRVMAARDLKLGDPPPAVIVLADVARLQPAQVDAIEQFLAQGGGLLVVVGDRAMKERDFYNDRLYQDGHGWLPAKLGALGTAKDGVRPEPGSFQHPSLEVFRAAGDRTLAEARFLQWCRVELKEPAASVALLSNGDPWLVERPHGRGRVLLCTVPLDRRWGSTLPGAWEYPILVHELVYYLAGHRNGPAVLEAGEPLRMAEMKAPMMLTTPDHARQRIKAVAGPWAWANTGAIGLYRLETAEVPTAPAPLPASEGRILVVPPQPGESNLMRCSDDDWAKVRRRLPVLWRDASEDSSSALAPRVDLWWVLLLAVLGLLCVEVWLTRRMMLARGR